ncbi:MAG: ATP-binding protein [candidate division KSB1 bacterium]|nr:ATP-binding protein [candidate division KSB1 bacterium]MDZ7302751.1 ATP-binding protein [candidate division KSB1 bacterium]MDZ7310081.1 ATP-binding protein [candidate division KSB1 bacterium]
MRFSLIQSSRTLIFVVSIMIIVVLAAFNFGTWFFLNRLSRLLDHELGNRLSAVAGLVARQVQTTGFADLVAEGQLVKAKSSIDLLIDGLPGEVNVQNIFLIDHAYQTLKASRDIFMPGEEISFLEEDSSEVHRAWVGEATSSPLRLIAGNRFKTAYAPVRNSRGSIVCLVAVEARADFLNLLQPFKRGLVIGGVASFVVLIIFAFFLYTAISLFLRTQEELRRSERLAAMGQVAATVAHEIRNPLGIIKSTADVLRQRYEKSAQPDELFEFIPSEVRRLNRLVNDFLSLTRDRRLSPSPGDLVKTVEKALTMVRSDEQADGIAWDFAATVPSLPMRYDEEAIKQVLLNLLLNAIQAMEGKGRLEVRLQEESDKDKKLAHLVVQDDGPGLPVEPEKIFEPFFTTKSRGSGLGLAVCKQLVEKHGGRIAAETEKGKGTRMHVWLPI